ncbi:MAG: sodium/proline symporter [Gammaproteobacteria bacterium]|nr:sodium/proline symporter [Gammaproteobacteria bacterium]
MLTIAIVFFAYLLMLFSVALWTRQATGSLSGFFLANKRLPAWVVAFSVNATGESGWLLLGLTGMGYAVGAQALWIVLGEVIGIGLAWGLLARRIKRMADESDSITVPDLLASRFDDPKNILRRISVLIILVMVGAYVSAQMVATGKAFSSFTTMDYSTAVVFGAAIIIAYTFIGGYKAVSYTDLAQGMLMLAGLIFVPAVAITSLGGWDAMMNELASQDPALLSPWGPQGKGVPGWVAIVSFIAIGMPFLGVPQLHVRFMSAESEASLKTAGIISVLVIFAFTLGAVLTGMAGRALFPGLDDPETILPLLSTELFPEIITGLLMVIVLAAIMSTVDSLLLLASSALVRDYLQQIHGSTKSDRDLARYGKFATLVIGALGIAFALMESPLIFWFVLFAWSGLGAAFGPVLICCFFYKRMTLYGAAAGILGGFLTSVGWVLLFKSATFGLYEVIPGFAVGLLLIIVVSRLK